MAGSTTKKVQVYRFEREPLSGYVNPGAYLTENGAELLTLNGSLALANYTEIKAVLFVREFDSAIELRRAFLSRPKLEGLWLKLTFRDDDVQEAIMPNNLLNVEPLGFNLIPPDTTLRLWVPRQALSRVEVLGVVGGRSAAGTRQVKPPAKEQIGLFEES